MIEKLLIGAGLAIIPFISVPGWDTRQPKLALAMALAMALSLWVISQGYIRKVANKWIYLLVGWCILRCFISPQFLISLGDVKADSLWQWKPMAEIIIFFMMFISVASLKFAEGERKMLFSIISWVGSIMAIYAIVQSLNIEQFFYQAPYLAQSNLPDSPKICGTLGQPTVLASFLAIVLPIAISLRKYVAAALIAAAILATNSHVAMIAMGITILYIIGTKNKLRKIISTILLGAMILTAAIAIRANRMSIPDSGRFATWKNIATQLKSCPITGFGLGSFKYVYHDKFPGQGRTGKFTEAHNDYIQWTYETGLIGLALLVMAIWEMRKRAGDRFVTAALLASGLCAMGSFPWQLGAHIYYTVFLLGILYAREVKNGHAGTDL